MYTNKNIIAIDGGAGTGKSLLSSLLSIKLGIRYIDTGQFYRLIALFSKDHVINDFINKPISYYYKNIDLSVSYNGLKPTHSLNGVYFNEEIKGSEISLKASILAENICIRLYVTDVIHNLIKNDNFIVSGRDISTFVYPYSKYKIYIDTPIPVRAKRIISSMNYNEILFNSIMKEISERDYRDMNRSFAPLIKTKNQLVLDTSELTTEKEICFILEYINHLNNK
jgi:cytidylate kinase